MDVPTTLPLVKLILVARRPDVRLLIRVNPHIRGDPVPLVGQDPFIMRVSEEVSS